MVSPLFDGAFLSLQALQVAILWLHDWVPLGRLNDVPAVRAQDTTGRLVRVTIIQSVPFSVVLVGGLMHFGAAYPMWLAMWAWYSYVFFSVGYLFAWWIPYTVGPSAEKAARYKTMFGNTSAFLPVRHGIVPNTLHCVLHGATWLTVAMLYLRERMLPMAM